MITVTFTRVILYHIPGILGRVCNYALKHFLTKIGHFKASVNFKINAYPLTVSSIKISGNIDY